MSDISTQHILTALMANVFSLPPRVESISGQSFKYVQLGDVLALIEEASEVAALTTPEPQTGERDDDAIPVGMMWLSRMGVPRASLRDGVVPTSEPEILVRLSDYLAERTAREAAERRPAEVEERP